MTLVKKIDTERNRKLLVANRAMDRVFLSLVACLVAGWKAPASAAMIGTVFAAGAAAIVASAKLMFDANVKVHQATGGEPPAGTP